MNHLRWGKVFTIPGPVLNYGGPDIGGAQLMPVPPPKNPGCPIFGVGMPHGEAAGDALRVMAIGVGRCPGTAPWYLSAWE